MAELQITAWVLGVLAVGAAVIAGLVYLGVRLALRHGPLWKGPSWRSHSGSSFSLWPSLLLDFV